MKTQLESIRNTDNQQPRIAEGDNVRVVINKKFKKGYMPDWSDEVYAVESVSKVAAKPLSRIYRINL